DEADQRLSKGQGVCAEVDHVIKCHYVARGTPDDLLIRGLGSVGEIGTPRNRTLPLGSPSAAGGGRLDCGSNSGVLHTLGAGAIHLAWLMPASPTSRPGWQARSAASSVASTICWFLA